MAIEFGAEGWGLRIWFKISDPVFPICQHTAVREGKAIPYYNERVVVHADSPDKVTIIPLKTSPAPPQIDYNPEDDGN